MLGVQQAGVNLGGRPVPQADHKDLSRGVAGGCRLGGLHLVKQLLEGVQQRIVVLGPADDMPLIKSISLEVALLSIPETMLTPRILAEPDGILITALVACALSLSSLYISLLLSQTVRHACRL